VVVDVLISDGRNDDQKEMFPVGPGNFTNEDPWQKQASYGLLCTWLQ